MTSEQPASNGAKENVSKEKKQENVAGKKTEDEKKIETPQKETTEQKALQPDTTSPEKIIIVEKDSLLIDFSVLKQQIDEMKKEIDELRKKVESLEKK